MYVSIGMYGLETEVITLHTCRGHSPLRSGLLQNPNRLPAPLPPTGRVPPRGYSVWKHRAFFWCLDLGAASLVPLSVSFQYVYHGCSEASLF